MKHLLLFFLIFTRWITLITIAPVLGTRTVPALLKISLAIFLSLPCWVVLYPSTLIPNSNSLLYLLSLFMKEALLGIILGTIIGQVFFLYELCGQIMDFARSANTINQFVPEMESQSSMAGKLMFFLSLAVYFSLGLHQKTIELVSQSFILFPVLSFDFINSKDLFINFITILSDLFHIAVNLSLPVIIICFFTDFCFGLLNRLVPEINAYFLSLPLKLLSGLIVIFFIITLLAEKIKYHNNYFIRHLLPILIIYIRLS